MSKEICISSTPHETRLAILENEQLTEVYYERENEYTLAGSIYKGRVTRVLPGMQSAFVDVGLERDAFLYVTDFMEEQEDSSEFERIPASGRTEEAAQEPRENASRPNQGGQRRDARPPRPPQPAISPEGNGAPRSPSVPVSTGGGSEGQAAEGEFEDGTRRWRGRRGRRKGSRPPQEGRTGIQQGRSDQAPPPLDLPEEREPSAAMEAAEPRPPAKFSLPGESLSKYGGQTAAPIPAKTSATPSRPTTGITKPSTMVEVPLHWDGAGPLPGESISRYRGAPEASPTAAVEPVVEHHASMSNDVLEAVEPNPAMIEAEPVVAQHDALVETAAMPAQEEPQAVVVPEVQAEAHPTPAEEPVAAAAEFEPHEASASYRIDPSAPSEFRFASSSSLAEEELAPEAETAELEHPGVPEEVEEKKHHENAAFSAASTGIAELDADFEEFDEEEDAGTSVTGLVEEEEVTEEEEYDFTPLYVDSEEHDLQELEEETLAHEVPSGGELGEMVRDAHLDQRISDQRIYGDASGSLVEEEAENELDDVPAHGVKDGEAEEGLVAAAPGQPGRRPRDDQGRGGRGGRGGRNDGRRRQNGRRNAQTSDLPIISELLKQGQEILVQIAKEPIAKKGARITSHIALPGRFLVFMPTVNHWECRARFRRTTSASGSSAS